MVAGFTIVFNVFYLQGASISLPLGSHRATPKLDIETSVVICLQYHEMSRDPGAFKTHVQASP